MQQRSCCGNREKSVFFNKGFVVGIERRVFFCNKVLVAGM